MTEVQLIESLIQALTHLTRHLEAENTALAKNNAAALKPMAAEKDRLSAEYTKIMEAVRRNPVLVDSLSEDDKLRLRQAGRAFNAVMEEHRRRVTVLKTVGEGIIQAISEHVTARNRPASYGYGDSSKRRPVNTQPTSIALDQNI
jgi:hypothetical protein